MCGAVLRAQVVSGSITDAVSGQPLAFASIGLKKNMSGTVSNEEGRFDFIIPANSETDTLVFMAFGYRRMAIAVSSASSPLSIRLTEAPVQLNEIDVKPKPPEFYITLAMRNLKNNYPEKPFETMAYYREKVLENKKFIKMDEGVFKTYCPRYQDSVRNQDQLLLFRTAENISELQFMKEEREKQEQKNKERVAKGKKPEESNVEMDLAGSFGGPASLLKSSRISGRNITFLDTTAFKDYRYTFAKSSSYDNSNLMVIEFVSKGVVDHSRESGKIYIDRSTYAIARIESSGDFVIPVLIRPVIFMAGYGVNTPTFSRHVEFKQAGEKWYPMNTLTNINVELTRRHWFAKNEHSAFEIEQAFIVNRLDITTPSAVAADKRFKSDKPMKDQVKNDQQLTWDQVNVIRR